jgi:hypothetical protein
VGKTIFPMSTKVSFLDVVMVGPCLEQLIGDGLISTSNIAIG